MTPSGHSPGSEWRKAEPWPERRRAPGYPLKVKLPVSILAVVAVLVALVGIRLDSSALFFFGSLGLFTVGWLAVCSVTLCRFHCPECGQRVPFKLPPLGEPIDFPCPRCRVIWTAGMDHTQAD